MFVLIAWALVAPAKIQQYETCHENYVSIKGVQQSDDAVR